MRTFKRILGIALEGDGPQVPIGRVDAIEIEGGSDEDVISIRLDDGYKSFIGPGLHPFQADVTTTHVSRIAGTAPLNIYAYTYHDETSR
jgi:hypothetical protein